MGDVIAVSSNSLPVFPKPASVMCQGKNRFTQINISEDGFSIEDRVNKGGWGGVLAVYNVSVKFQKVPLLFGFLKLPPLFEKEETGELFYMAARQVIYENQHTNRWCEQKVAELLAPIVEGALRCSGDTQDNARVDLLFYFMKGFERTVCSKPEERDGIMKAFGCG